MGGTDVGSFNNKKKKTKKVSPQYDSALFWKLIEIWSLIRIDAEEQWSISRWNLLHWVTAQVQLQLGVSLMVTLILTSSRFQWQAACINGHKKIWVVTNIWEVILKETVIILGIYQMVCHLKTALLCFHFTGFAIEVCTEGKYPKEI